MRIGLVGAVLAAVAALTTGCGGPPDDASKKDFCKAYKEAFSAVSGDFDDQKKAWEKLEEVGTPKSIDGDAREGFETMIDIGTGADSSKDAEEKFDDLDSDETDKIEKFGEAAVKTCGSSL